MKSNHTWKLLPHGPLVKHADNLWTLDGTLPLPLRRRMTIIRDSDNQLVLHSPVAADGATMAAIEALGPIRLIVIPNGYLALTKAKGFK